MKGELWENNKRYTFLMDIICSLYLIISIIYQLFHEKTAKRSYINNFFIILSS